MNCNNIYFKWHTDRDVIQSMRRATLVKNIRVLPLGVKPITLWAQLFEGRLALNPGLNLTPVSFSLVQNHFLG